MKKHKCKFCKELLSEMEIEQYEKDGYKLCWNWENECNNPNFAIKVLNEV